MGRRRERPGRTRTDLAGAGVLAACAALAVTAAVGLCRLRLWGLGLTIGAHAAIAGLAVAGAIEVSPRLASLLVAVGLFLLVLPAPLVLARLRGRRPVEADRGTLSAALMSGAVLLLMSAALVGLAAPFWPRE